MAVVGAGAAGLCAARHLISDPDNFCFTVYEQQDDVGGTWRYTDKVGKDEYGLPVHSSMYRELRTNLPKEAMAFPDFPFPECNDKSFVHHTVVLQYLKDYARKYDIYEKIQFCTLVQKVYPKKVDENKVIWEVTVCNLISQEMQTNTFDSVMVCNGHYSVPHIPDIKGMDNFKGILLHSHEYRSSEKFKGMKVVVLGAGASGIDISIELTSSAKEVVMSHNLPPYSSALPSNLIQEPGIELFEETSVTFTNGKSYACDAVVICTGYLYTYPFLHPDCHITIGDQHVMPLYKHLIHTEFPTLAIWAIPKQILPFPIYDQQVILYLKYLKGAITLPSRDDMEADFRKDFQERLSRGMKPRHAHVMRGQLQWEYDDQLAELGEIPRIPEAVRNLFRQVHAIRKKDVVNYKNCNFKLSNNSFVES